MILIDGLTLWQNLQQIEELRQQFLGWERSQMHLLTPSSIWPIDISLTLASFKFPSRMLQSFPGQGTAGTGIVL